MTACIDTIHVYYPFDIVKGKTRIDIQDIVRVASENNRIVRIKTGYIEGFSVWEAPGTSINFEAYKGLVTKLVWKLSSYENLDQAYSELKQYDQHYDARSGLKMNTGLISKGIISRIDLFLDYPVCIIELMAGLDIENRGSILGMADYEDFERSAGKFRSYRIGRSPVTFRIYDKYRETSTRGRQSAYQNPTTRIEVMLEKKSVISRKLGLSGELRLALLRTQLRALLEDGPSIFDGVTLRHVSPHALERFRTEKQRIRAIQFHRDWETGTFFDVRRLMNSSGNGNDALYRKYFSISRYAERLQPANLLRRNLAYFIGTAEAETGHQLDAA